MENEYQLQEFIGENPWLLNQNYETLPQLPKNGLEFSIGAQQRIDLVLRDKINKVPVVVEFKFHALMRDNIGQILEYRARMASTFNRDQSLLFDIFGDFVLAPKLVLVVKQCDDFFRVACNLSGIEVFEFKNISSVFSDPTKVKTIQAFTESLRNERVPLSLDRGQKIEELVYRPIRAVLERHKLSDVWIEPRESSGFFFPQYARLFINRWLFKDETISIGLYEEFLAERHTVCLCFYSANEAALREFSESYNSTSSEKLILKWHSEWAEGYLKRHFDPNTFFLSAGELFETEWLKYLKLTKQGEKKAR